jgi:hypothetical protein
VSATQELLAVELGSATSFAYALQAQEDPNGTDLNISWTGVPNRNPSTSGDFVALWQNDGSVPFGTAAQNTQQISDTTPDGDTGFGGLSLAKLPYVVAYSVGADAKNFYNLAAAIPIGLGGVTGPVQATTVSVGWIGARSLTIDYTTIVGSDPKAFGHSLVLVHGQTYNPLNASPIATTQPSDNQNDAATFGGIVMVVGQWYTCAYLMGSRPSTVAATVTFQVKD